MEQTKKETSTTTKTTTTTTITNIYKYVCYYNLCKYVHYR